MNLSNFTIATEIPIKPKWKVRIKHRQTKPFLKGPVPMDWLYAAGSLPGQCLHVGILLWHESGMANNRTVPFRPSKARKFGRHRDTARRAIKHLENAGLIAVHYQPGRCLEITILDVPAAVVTVAENCS